MKPGKNDLVTINSSGGLDSTVLLYKVLKTTKADVILINYKYGQNHGIEIEVQKKLYRDIKEDFGDRVLGNITIDLGPVYKASKDVFDDLKTLRESKGIKDSTNHEFYTPSRNLLFMSAASALGELVSIAQGYKNLYLGIGVHKHSEEAYGKDGENGSTQYWDITPEFIGQLQNVLNLNDVVNIEIYAPYKNKFKKKIIKDMVKHKVDFKKTWTCYDPLYDEVQHEVMVKTCKKCEACVERELQGKLAGVEGINDYYVTLRKNQKHAIA